MDTQPEVIDERLRTESNFAPADDVSVAETVWYPPTSTGSGAESRIEVGLLQDSRDSTLEGRLRQAEAGTFTARDVRMAMVRNGRLLRVDGSNLPDIAQFSDAIRSHVDDVAHARMAEIVLGHDDRQRVPDPSVYPWSAIASLQITTRDGAVGAGTGWFISPRLLVTAGHCVFIQSKIPNRHGWVRKITVMPGRDGAITPYGAVTTTQFKSVNGWTHDADEGFDYGAIILPEASPLGATVGALGIGAFSDTDLQNLKVNISGYPDDKRGNETGTQWYDAQQIISADDHQLFYFVDTAGGQSGSPVFCLRDDQYVAAGIHAYGDVTSNAGTRITPDVLKVLQTWKGQ